MRVLGLDSSGDESSAALIADGAEPRVARRGGGAGHSRRLLSLVDDVVQASACALSGLDRIGVAVGPGAFTGVRVGVATANGLGWSLGVPVVGVSGLEAVAAAHASLVQGSLVVCLDARRDQVFIARFLIRDGRVQRTTADELLEPRLAFTRRVQGGDRVLGSGAERHALLLAEVAPDLVPTAVSAAAGLGVARLAAAATVGEATVAPRYLREPRFRVQGRASR